MYIKKYNHIPAYIYIYILIYTYQMNQMYRHRLNRLHYGNTYQSFSQQIGQIYIKQFIDSHQHLYSTFNTSIWWFVEVGDPQVVMGCNTHSWSSMTWMIGGLTAIS